MSLYREFSNQEEIDREYNLSALTSDLPSIFARYATASQSVRAELECRLDARYGPTLDESVDIFPSAQSEAPLLIFIHGGYFRSMSSKDFSFVAKGFTEAGISVAVTNYSLCPKVTIDEITRQNRAAVAWLYRNASQCHASPDKIFVIGHSAGGHQAAMLATTDWEQDYGLPADTLKCVIAVSGIYELEPLRFSFIQPILQLDDMQIRRQDPVRNVRSSSPPLLAIVGDKETAEFQRQSHDVVAGWRDAGLAGEFRVHPNAGHFTIIEELGGPHSKLTTEVQRFIGTNVRLS